VIRQIDSNEATQATRQAPAPRAVEPATPAGKTFQSVLAREKTAADRTQLDKLPITAPQGEVWRPVRGDDNYAKIIDGPRAGMYVNLSRGDRRGEVFRVEEREGKRVHVYGEGDAQKVVDAAKDSGKVRADKHDAHAAARNVPKNEEWAPVKGANNYADILNGPRNGLYVNTSGGERDGMAFQIVRRGDSTYHVYGTGKHRQVVEVSTAPKKADEPKQTDAANGGTTATETESSSSASGTTGTGGASPAS
jgi:hypothetical protein